MKNLGRRPTVAALIAALAPSLLVTSMVAPPAGALAASQTISFEEEVQSSEEGNALTDEYASVGLTFSGEQGSLWAGRSGGDPGGWDIEGSNGTTFLGFNGGSYSTTVTLDERVAQVSLDGARSSGSEPGTGLTLEAYLDGVLVDSDSVEFGPVDEWSTLTVQGPLDEFKILGSGSGFRPFGVDNIVIGDVAVDTPDVPVEDVELPPVEPVTPEAPKVDVAPVAPAPAVTPVRPALGYRMIAADGGVFAFGDRHFVGSAADRQLAEPIVGGAQDRSDGEGYWIVSRGGSVVAFDATHHGDVDEQASSAPAVAIESTPSGKGYWIVLADGRVHAFGDAVHAGDLRGRPLNAPVIGVSASSTGNGYWIVAADGGVFAFGDATFFGSTGDRALNEPIVDLAPAADGHGYYLLGRDGGVFAFGSAPYLGSAGDLVLNAPVVGMVVAPKGVDGYWLAAADGGVFSFGDAPFLGSMGQRLLNSPVRDLMS